MGTSSNRSQSDHHDPNGRTRRTAVIASALFVLTIVELVVAVVGSVMTATSWQVAVESYVVTNCVIGVSCAISGLLIAWHRPRNPVGWLLAAGGVLQTLTAAVGPLLRAAIDHGSATWLTRTLLSVYACAWPWSIGLCLPLALLLFPDGRVPGPHWRWLLWLGVIIGTVSAVGSGTGPIGVDVSGGFTSWLILPGHELFTGLWQSADVAVNGMFLVGLAAVVVRYRRGDETLRRQLLWLVLALIVVIAVQVMWGPLVPGLAILNLLSIALLPISMAVAVLRYQLLDIRLVLSRTVLYLLLSAAVLGIYLLLVGVAGVLLVEPTAGTSALITLLIAVGFNPVRVRLQLVVDRALYGDRTDPVRVITRIGKQLAGGDERDVLHVVTETLRLPFAALLIDEEEWAAYGTPSTQTESITLTYQGTTVGQLVVGLRAGERRLGRADRAALELVAAPLAVAAHATTLSDDLQKSREEIITSREEERRRLRRDLHDGLGPALTGIAFQADAARNLVRSDPSRAEQLLASLRTEAADAIGDVRRLVYALRPPSLDELGLAGALRRQVEHLNSATQAVSLHVPVPLPALPAAVEVAAYRISLEALTNAVRHSRADRIDVRLELTDALEITVDDNGSGNAPWRAGVGLVAMRERAAELGGTLLAQPNDGGSHVVATLPIATTVPTRSAPPMDPIRGPSARTTDAPVAPTVLEVAP